jgi:hypothetical protein
LIRADRVLPPSIPEVSLEESGSALNAVSPHSYSRRTLLRNTAAAALSLLVPASRAPQPQSKVAGPIQNPYVDDGILRIDVRHFLRADNDTFALERLRLESGAGEPHAVGADRLGWGDYRLELRDLAERVLFSAGFDACSGAAGSRGMSIRCPAPTEPVQAVIGKRRIGSAFQECWRMLIDPASDAIDRGRGSLPVQVKTLLSNGPAARKVDLAILGDGYRASELEKFVSDAARATDHIFSVDPFAQRRRDFNVRAVFTPSRDNGVTDAYLGLRRDTAFACSYGSGALERTLDAGDNRAVREAASVVPYDFVLILVNAQRYGGSACFGGPAVVAVDSAAARYLVLHEFAHVIGGLADEYYIPDRSGPVYRGNIEPWNPNVTTQVQGAKWRSPNADRTERPTPWNKHAYESQFARYVERYYQLRAAHANEAAIDRLMHEFSRTAATLLDRPASRGREVGWFEGANGYAKGFYRAEVDCIMFSLQTHTFCSACSAAITAMIDAHCT